MATFYLKLKRIQGKCRPDSSAPCANLGELQAKLGSLNIVKSNALSCPDTVNFKPSGPFGVQFSSPGRLHLHKGNQRVYTGDRISENSPPNGKSLFSAAGGAMGEEQNCEISVDYAVNTNLLTLTRRFVRTVVKLVYIFFRRLFSAVFTYVQSFPIALAITVDEFLSSFRRSNPDRPDKPDDKPDDDSEPPR